MVKRTGQIVKVVTVFDHKDGVPAIAYEVLGHPGIKYRPEELEFNVTFDYIEKVVSEIQTVNIGYWDKLLYQYAGMAMQGIISRHNVEWDVVVNWSVELATALVEKLKEEN